MNRISGALATLAALLCVVLGMQVVSPATASAATSSKPKVGQCHALTMKQAWAVSDTKKAVSCSKKHTTQTFAVLKPTAPLLGADADSQATISYDTCRAAWLRHIHGADLVARRTVLNYYIFLPTPAQIRAGQEWVRCDLALLGRKGNPSRTTGKINARTVIKHSRADKYALCESKRGVDMPCSYPHTYRAMKVFKISAGTGADYPGTDGLSSQAAAHCPRSARYNSVISEESWNAGARLIWCWKKE